MIEVPAGSIDFGNGCYIEILLNSESEVIFRSCSRGGAICRYSNDFWHAKTYIYQMMSP